VRGEHDAWLTDPAYPTGGSHEERYNAGDKQRVLWQIYDCSTSDTPIPKWAVKALTDSLVAVVTCQSTWDKEFGEVPAKGPDGRPLNYQPKLRKYAKYLIPIGEAARNYHPKGARMYGELADEFGVDFDFVKDCWQRYKLAHDF
jgi:hypothetical protein